MISLRRITALWPLAFIVPMWALLGRFCWSRPVHELLHGTMLLHERLPMLGALAATISMGVVIVKIARVNASLTTLRALAAPQPDALRCALVEEARALAMRVPPVTYLDVETPICYTVMPGPAILISRGFIGDLDATELRIVVRHELVHVRRRDPLRGLLWHLFFSALLIPAFGGLERWLYDRRERRTNALAGAPLDARFERLTRRVRHTEMGLERSLGKAYAGALRPQVARKSVFIRPTLGAAVVAALVASHVFFMDSLPMLERHHC